jgi:hypothetical protein
MRSVSPIVLAKAQACFCGNIRLVVQFLTSAAVTDQQGRTRARSSLVWHGSKTAGGAREALDRLKWRPLRGVDKPRLHEARLQAHYAVQWLARAARAYVPRQPDDGHTSLQWEDGLDGFVTHPLSNGMRVSLQITTLTLALHSGDGQTCVQSFPLTGRTDMQAGEWVGEQLGACGFDARALDGPSPYKIPEHAIAQGASYDAAGSAEAQTELAAWYANAQAALGRVERLMIERKLTTSPVCCWPHHFDLATLTLLPTSNVDITGSIGAGFSPGDEYYDEPYFYVSVYPEPSPVMLPALPAMGHWHTHEFTAGVKPAHKILSAKDRATETGDFLQGTVAIALKILGEAAK